MDTYSELVADTAPAAGSTEPKPTLDEVTGDRPTDRARAAALMTRWERETTAAYLTAYALAVRGASSYPSDPNDVARLIDLFVLENALYEVRYELGSRPDWVRIPIAGLLERMQDAAAAL